MIIKIALAKENVVIVYFRRYLFFSFSTLSLHERVCDILPPPSVYCQLPEIEYQIPVKLLNVCDGMETSDSDFC